MSVRMPQFSASFPTAGAQPSASRAVTAPRVSFRNTSPKKPDSQGGGLVRAEINYTPGEFQQLFRNFLSHLEAMPAGKQAETAQWLIKQNLYFAKDKTGKRMNDMSNRDFVVYLATSNFFMRAEHRDTLAGELKTTTGFWQRYRYPARVAKVGVQAGYSHEYRKDVAAQQRKDPGATPISLNAFIDNMKKASTAVPAFPMRFDNPLA